MNDDNSEFKKAYDITFSIDRDTAEYSLNSVLNINSCKLSFMCNESQQYFSQDFGPDKNFYNSSSNSYDEIYIQKHYSSVFEPDLENSEKEDSEDSSFLKYNLSVNSLYQNSLNNSNIPTPITYIQKGEGKEKNKNIFLINKEIKEIKGNNNDNDNKKYLFSNVRNYESNKREIKDIKKKRERFEHLRKRYKNTDLILKKITTSFINKYLIKAINNKSNKIFFDKANKELIKSITYQKDKETNLNMTLKQLFMKANLYKKQFDILEKEKNKEIEEILNTTYFDLFKEYVNSDEFKIKEINRLKKKENTSEEWYINRYIYLSENFFEYKTKKK